jgi:hypothetical protein
MTKNALTLFILLFSFTIFAQEKKESMSFEFKDISRKKAIETIEKSTAYTFYYQEEWLTMEPISAIYKNESIETILEDLLNKTDLNFFINKNKIILTKNSIIYDKLIEINLDQNSLSKNQNNDLDKPVFYKQFDSINNSKKKVAIAFIGKETKNTEKKSQTLSGYVESISTGKRVSNLVLKVKNTKIRAITDENGFYSMQVPYGVNIIESESFDYKKISRNIMMYNDGDLNISLTENINQLNEVIIKGKKSKTIETTVSGLTSIDIEAVKNVPLVLGERDILKVATTLPGIKTTGEGSAGFNVRGGKDDQNLMLLDNAVLYNPSHFFGFFSAINPYTTSKANIYKGSIPAEFGGRLSSVFDITSKNGGIQKFSLEGGVGPVTSSLAARIPIIKGKSNLMVGGRATYSDWILKQLDDESLKNSQASFYDAIIKYNHIINKKNALETTLYYSKDAFSISSDSLYKYSNRMASLKWNHTFSDKIKGDVILTNSEYQFNIDYNSAGINAFDFGFKINETQLMLKLNHSINQKHKLSYGFSSKLYAIDPGYLDPKKAESTLVASTVDQERGLESAVYLSDNFKISDRLLVDIGFRYSYFSALGESTQRIYSPDTPINDATVIDEKNYGKNEVIKSYGGFEPRIAARYFINEDLSLKAGYDVTRQYIHLLSSNTTQSPTDIWKLSDLNTEPQVAEQYSLGVFKNLDNNMLELSVEGYFKKSKNILDYKVGAELLLNQNVETELLQGEGKAYGVEFLLKKNDGDLTGWIGYTYSRTFIKLDSAFLEEKINNGDYFPTNYDKPHYLSAVLNYKIAKRYSFSSNFMYQTGRPITYPIGNYNYGNAQYPLYSDRNKFRIPDYYRLDIGFNIEANHKKNKFVSSFWNISVYNVLGRNNPYSIYFVTENGKVKGYQTSIFSIPIPTITYNFKF